MEFRDPDDPVMAILQAALERPEQEREAFVRAECDGEDALQREVVEALAWEERMGGFLKRPLLDLASLARPFDPGQTIAGRFTIQREIGEGGMGFVFEAFDEKLQQRIAIKAAKPGFQRLLSPELTAALRVRHRNICLVKEIHTAQTEYGEIDFLAMEFLEGETLSQYLRKVGKVQHEEALDIACQVCAGLAEAHRSGIIHRDLKSGNIILCKNEDGSPRAVITDFGLAGGASGPAGELAGTPAYMAPELWQGEPCSTASDIYALGVILYEMVAGRRPYEGENDERLARQSTVTLGTPSPQQNAPSMFSATTRDALQQRQTAPPLPPSTWVKDLDARWDRVIMGCLKISPAERIQDADEVQAELRRKPFNWAPFLVAGAAILLLAAVVGLVRPVRQRVMDFVSPPNVRLAVLPFDGPQDLAAIANGALQDAAERVQLLPTQRRWPFNKLSRTLAVIPPSRLANLHITTPQQAREVLHATDALALSLLSQNGKLTGSAVVIDLSSQIQLRQLSVQYAEGDVGALPSALVHFLAMVFRLHGPSSEDALSAPAKPAYLNGLYLINRDIHSFDEALAQFQQAARLDPQSALPEAGMALALVQKYNSTRQNVYLEQAKESVRLAQGRNADSVRVLLAAGRVSEATRQWNKALQVYRRVEEVEPRNVDLQQRLGLVYEGLEEPAEALAALRKAQELDPEYYRSYQLLGEFFHRQGQYEEAADQFRKTVARAPGFYDGYSSLGGMLIELGRFKDAEEALRTSLRLRETPQALNNLGAAMAFQGRYKEAVTSLKKALSLDPNHDAALMNIGDNLRWAGSRAEAATYYRQGREKTLQEMTANPKNAGVRALYAYFCVRLGGRHEAEQEITEALNFSPSDSEVSRLAVLTYEALGKREQAINATREMTLQQMRDLEREPDLAEFSRDPRFKQQMVEKGDQHGYNLAH